MTSPEPPRRKLHRLPVEVYASPFHEFFFTVCARHQGTPFEDPRLAHAVIDSLLWTKRRYDWIFFCYCLMPDHLHFVCRLTQQSDFSNRDDCETTAAGVLEHVARFKSHTTRESWKLGRTGPLWQKSSYDRVLDMERSFGEVAQYVLENPVRRGLARRWDEWPYSAIVDSWDVS